METKVIDYWKRQPEWTLEEFIFLLNETDPDGPFQALDAEYARVDRVKCRLESRAFEHFNLEQREDLVDGFWYSAPPEEFIAWALTLDDVVLPKFLQSMFTHQEEVDSLSENERNNLLLTIGALSMALVKSTGKGLLIGEKPNKSQIAEACMAQSGAAKKMGKSTLRSRIRQGLEALEEKK